MEIERIVSIPQPPEEVLKNVRAACAWIVDNYGPKLRTDAAAYGSSHDVLMGRLILAEDVLRIIDGDDRP